jgi:predicted nuclease with RNAse H fold
MRKFCHKAPCRVVGLDLAGVEHRPSGFCVLMRKRVQTKLLYGDAEILDEIINSCPGLVAIDAPLSLPRGRCCLENDCICRGRSHLRECDRAVRRLGIPIFALTLGSMRVLTIRGMRVRDRLEKEKIPVIETYPGGAQDLWGIPRQKDPMGLKKGLLGFGLDGDIKRRKISCHELDAITCALVAQEHQSGCSLVLGDPDEGVMVLPGTF